jgi:phenylalanyl-tRNA synthetase alpha chain
MKLHPKARDLLATVKDYRGKVNVDDLEDEMSHGDIMRPAKWLEEEDLLMIIEETRDVYRLTSKGEEAYVNGLPEERLLELLESDGPVGMSYIKQQITAFNVAIGECKKNGWVELEEGKDEKHVDITDKGVEKLDEGFPEDDILADIYDGKSPADTPILDRLMDRGLVELDEETVKILEETEKAENMEQLDELASEEADTIGKLTPGIIRTQAWKDRGIREYDVEKEVDVKRPGKKHPYRKYLDEVRKQLMAMGFQEAKTDLVEMEFWNFDVLFQAQDHPAREIHDKFELKEPSHGDLMDDEMVDRVKQMHEEGWTIDSVGWEYDWDREQASRLMLRSQTTATTIRYLARGLDSPAKVFAIDRNFRYDEIDKTHFVEFYQAEGIVKAEDLSLKDLFGYLKVFGEEIADAEKIRFRPGYFPFTEPSVELDAYHPEMGWIELGGAGLFRPEVRSPLGVDEPVIAWGMGIDRLAMFKLGIEDIRELVFPQDLDYLRSSPAVFL